MEAPIEHHSIVISNTSHGGFQLVMGVPPHGWSTKEQTQSKMDDVSRSTPISGNPHMG